MLNGERLAITTGSRDRNLSAALSTWSDLPEPDVIVVVDWGSRSPVKEILKNVSDPRLVVVRAETAAWQNSRCHNLEFQVASQLECDRVLRVDNDVLVDPSFFSRHPVGDRAFWAVDCHRVPPEVDDKRNLCGTVMVATRHWRRVNGYNERLVQYGYEDEDFYSRLCQTGLTWRHCDIDTLDHIPHPNRSRLANLSSDLKIREMFGHLPPDEADLAATKFLITMSQQISTCQPWTNRDPMTKWEIEFEHNYGTATPCPIKPEETK
jgi:hypothetical protein